MAQEQNHSSSGGCTNGVARSSKKFKQNKVPQRGLGVAQLEKIRLEEQQISPSNSSSCLASPTDHPSSSKPFTPPSIIQRSTDVRPNSISKLVSNNGGECRMGWQGISSAGRGSWPNSLNDEYNLGGGIGHKVDHQVSNALLSSVRSQPFHGTCPSSMVSYVKSHFVYSFYLCFRVVIPLLRLKMQLSEIAGECVSRKFIVICHEFLDGAPFKPKPSQQQIPTIVAR